MFAAALLMGFGISMYYYSGLGSDPNSILFQAVARLLGLSEGVATILAQLAIVAVFLIFNRKHVHVGTFIQAFCAGFGINLGMALWRLALPAAPLFARVLLCFGGAVACGVALAAYLACDLGASAVDILILTLCEKIHKSYKWGFYIIYAATFLLGVLLGGTWGVGTLISLVLTGPITDFLLPKFRNIIKKSMKMT